MSVAFRPGGRLLLGGLWVAVRIASVVDYPGDCYLPYDLHRPSVCERVHRNMHIYVRTEFCDSMVRDTLRPLNSISQWNQDSRGIQLRGSSSDHGTCPPQSHPSENYREGGELVAIYVSPRRVTNGGLM